MLRVSDTPAQYRDIQYDDYIKCEQAIPASDFVCSHWSTTYTVSLRLLNITQNFLWTTLSRYHSIELDILYIKHGLLLFIDSSDPI